MVDRAREQLLGYLLGALEDSEQESIARRLAHNPELMRELSQIGESLQPLWVAQPDFAPPAGLAARTCELIASYPAPRSRSLTREAAPNASAAVSPVEPTDPAAVSGRASAWWDVAVAAGIVVAASLLVFPAIQNSRFRSRLAECQNHLRQIGLALTQYSETHDDYFPPVYDQGRLAGAGFYAPVLMTNGFVDGSYWFVCPGSPLAENRQFQVPSPDQLLSAASEEESARLRNDMGGSFAYSLGFWDHGRYHSPRNLRRPFSPVMGDAPSTLLPNYQSVNHGGRGQNLLHEDGHVLFWCSPQPHVRADHVFINDWGVVDAGKHRNDSVIGPSHAFPRLSGKASRQTEL